VKKIIAILLICSVALYAAPPFTLETVIPKLYRLKGVSNNTISVPIVDYIELQRNLDKVERKIREMDAFRDSTFTQTDTARTNADGRDTVYLPYKYESTRYGVFVTPASMFMVAAYALTDSSFWVATYVEDLATMVPGSGKYQWFTIGLRKK
jgi:hypothetical protein